MKWTRRARRYRRLKSLLLLASMGGGAYIRSMHRTYQYRLLPNKEQREALGRALAQTRYIYNSALDDRIQSYNNKKSASYLGLTYKTLTKFDQMKALTQWRKESFNGVKNDWLGAWVQHGALDRLDKAYQAFYRRVKSGGEKAGFPRFKGKRFWKSLDVPHHIGYQVVGNRVNIKGLGKLKIKMHRPLPEGHKQCGLTLTQDGKGWLVSMRVEIEAAPDKKLVMPENVVGVDMGIKRFVTTSLGEEKEKAVLGAYYDYEREYRKEERQLRLKQRAVERSKKASSTLDGCEGKNLAKRRKAVQRLHEKIARRRKDFHHKLSTILVDKCDALAFEDLRVKNMVRNTRLSKSIHDAGWSAFVNMCDYKADGAGKHCVTVDAKGTSQVCSACGAIVRKDLSERTHKCDCGVILDRDHNAAINIKKRAVDVLARYNSSDGKSGS
ncbi:MAG: IS200/IS605 family element transposase accessory protein TnpB [Alphaproteobacteria bacterium GM202ARS2]|nr:IS200/IS605 family element transposase accessory protein TnpB [Alphaproteobacteria bacterium GM202ARS2]